MAKTMQLGAYENEAVLVMGLYNKNKMAEYKLYKYCADYYYESYRGMFYVPDDFVEDIFQDSFIKLWENIESRKIYVEDHIIKGKDEQPLSGSIRTYFMGIAKIKYLEWIRNRSYYIDPKTEVGRCIIDNGFDVEEYLDMFYGEYDGDNVMLEIISDSLSKMSPRCNEILTKYYYEGKKLDSILQEIPSIESKDALKTKKHKCLESLKDLSKQIYNKYLNYCN